MNSHWSAYYRAHLCFEGAEGRSRC